MAIHPIDLSTVYSQIDHVAKYNASQNQNTQIAGTLNQEQVAQANQEKAKGVQQTPENGEVDSAKIKDQENSQSGGEQSDGSRKNSSRQEEELKKRIIKIKDPRLGNYVDVRR